MLITNNKEFQTTIVKSALLTNGFIYLLNHNELFSLITSIKHLNSYKSKCINKNKENNKFFDCVISTKRLYSCKNKDVGKNSKDSNLKN